MLGRAWNVCVLLNSLTKATYEAKNTTLFETKTVWSCGAPPTASCDQRSRGCLQKPVRLLLVAALTSTSNMTAWEVFQIDYGTRVNASSPNAQIWMVTCSTAEDVVIIICKIPPRDDSRCRTTQKPSFVEVRVQYPFDSGEIQPSTAPLAFICCAI